MRKVKYLVASSLDNFIARPDGGVDWLFNDGTDYGMGEFFKTIDAVLLGRKTYEFALAHSPQPKQKSKSQKAKTKRASKFGMKSYVFSRTMKAGTDEDVNIISDNSGAFVRGLKAEAGKDIWLMGGGELAKSLFAENLVDEIGLNIHPVLLGTGISLFPDIGKQINLELIECKSHPNGCVQVTYRVKN
jgi:dihydrofolate reductase